MSENNNTLDGTEERAKIFFGNTEYHFNGTPMPELREHLTQQAVRFATTETATLTTQLNEMREALRAIEAKALCFPDSYNKVYRSNWWHLNTKARCGKSPRRHY